MMCPGGGKGGKLGGNKNVADLTMFFMFGRSPEKLSTAQFFPPACERWLDSLCSNLK